ncbi:hypothetical protein [Legionella spiritensis]|uniref:Uncharacterized protein n=1 Tax=Legionella spiritensis TaxID=452 RepID=A0A0W0Z899_LEGSP|nr:hypothetical protein [Legionella spiritensis]KTD65349.1 hypothetical protein Lspi_0666 [Legionella spiritensis]SNV47361.1 Uncharacterised protein [Legionella spiritensis]
MNSLDAIERAVGMEYFDEESLELAQKPQADLTLQASTNKIVVIAKHLQPDTNSITVLNKRHA